MVNVDYVSPSLWLGVGVACSGLVLYLFRLRNARGTKDLDIVTSSLLVLVGGILTLQGWRLDPILMLSEGILASVGVYYIVQTVELRKELMDTYEDNYDQGGQGGRAGAPPYGPMERFAPRLPLPQGERPMVFRDGAFQDDVDDGYYSDPSMDYPGSSNTQRGAYSQGTYPRGYGSAEGSSAPGGQPWPPQPGYREEWRAPEAQSTAGPSRSDYQDDRRRWRESYPGSVEPDRPYSDRQGVQADAEVGGESYSSGSREEGREAVRAPFTIVRDSPQTALLPSQWLRQADGSRSNSSAENGDDWGRAPPQDRPSRW